MKAMKTHLKTLAVILALGSIVALAAGCARCCKRKGKCDSSKAPATTSVAPLTAEDLAAIDKVHAVGAIYLTAADLDAKLKSSRPPVVVDVLGASSYAASHVKGAISIPHTEMTEVAPTALPDKNAEIVVYCGGYQCGASIKSAKALKEMGYTKVYDFKGGIQEWTARGLPVEGSGATAN